MKYSEKLKDPRWQQKRLEVFNRDKWTCTCCGDKKATLHVHHSKYTGEPWDAPMDDLTTLCKHCHFLIDYDSIVEQGLEIFKTIDKYNSVVFFIKNKEKGVAIYVKTEEDSMPQRRSSLNVDLLRQLFEFTKDMI